MLDELIRRYGHGITVAVKAESGEMNVGGKERRQYLGLKVDGHKFKKRPEQELRLLESPHLLNEAASNGAMKIIDYLAGPQPLAAYQFYAASQSDKCALYLRERTDLKTMLPKWLGWTINSIDESPLTFAILSNRIDVVKKLFQLEPDLMEEAMDTWFVSVPWLALQ